MIDFSVHVVAIRSQSQPLIHFVSFIHSFPFRLLVIIMSSSSSSSSTSGNNNNDSNDHKKKHKNGSSTTVTTTTNSNVRTYDWTAHRNDDGELYYYNDVTGESTWDEPPEGYHPESVATTTTTTTHRRWSVRPAPRLGLHHQS